MTSITDKMYPIQKTWILKQSFLAFFTAILVFVPTFLIIIASASTDIRTKADKLTFNLLMSYGTIIVIVGILVLVAFMILNLVLRIATFNYSIDEKFIVADQGIIARQKKYLPYTRIQHVIIKRDLFDKFLGLSSLAIENASQGGNQGANRSYAMMGGLAGLAMRRRMQQQIEIIGCMGNKMGIPGLKQADALIIQQNLLEKIQSHLNDEDGGSGL